MLKTILLPNMRITKALIRLHSHTMVCVLLIANPEDRFSHVEAQFKINDIDKPAHISLLCIVLSSSRDSAESSESGAFPIRIKNEQSD